MDRGFGACVQVPISCLVLSRLWKPEDFDGNSINNSWLGCSATLSTLLAFGGGQVAIGAVIISAATQWIVQLGLAELCSAMPSSGVNLYLSTHLSIHLRLDGH